MPQDSIWLQFGIVSIIVLATGVMWREVTKFVREQDKKRDEEREKQRAWQAEQDRIRDERWQTFLESMQAEWIAQDGRNNQTIKDMIAKVQELLDVVQRHDQFTREAIAVMRERTNK